ncbi:hypothetical protein HYU07_03365 [Candidatus Woesearchaeota archaeon]|nr:hypothetical protein [Candidatus Woesearchaeota archaeon]
MSDIEQKKKIISERVGEETLRILKDAGLDVDVALTEMLKNEEEEKAMRELKTAIPTVDNTMTSELVYLSERLSDLFGQEYARRLSLIGLSNDCVQKLYLQEKLIISSNDMNGQRKQPWVQRYFIMHDSTTDVMPEVKDMTLSELILITDDANSAFWRDREVLPKEARQAVCIAASCAQYTEARYAKAVNERTEKMEWSKAQNGAYVNNECLLLGRLKWGYHEKPAWTKETTDLKQYEK